MSVQPELMVIVGAAIVPASALAAFVARAAPCTGTSWIAAGAAFLWGMAVAAPMASRANDAATAAATLWLGPPAARLVVPGFVGPMIEEIAKSVGLVVVAVLGSSLLTTARGGAAAGAMIGLGFAAVENVGYYTLAAVQGGYPGILRAVYLRGIVQGLNHATFTALIGVAVGSAHARHLARSRAIAAVGAGLAAAVGVHAAWNIVASVAITTVLCNAPAPGGACAAAPDGVDLFLTVPAIVTGAIGPVAYLLATRLRRGAT